MLFELIESHLHVLHFAKQFSINVKGVLICLEQGRNLVGLLTFIFIFIIFDGSALNGSNSYYTFFYVNTFFDSTFHGP
jgi:hypothetical protein